MRSAKSDMGGMTRADDSSNALVERIVEMGGRSLSIYRRKGDLNSPSVASGWVRIEFHLSPSPSMKKQGEPT